LSFSVRLLGFIISRQFHETLVADFAVYIVLIQPLNHAADFRNAFLRLFKLLGGCGGLSLAANLVLLDKQLHKPALLLGCVFGHLPEICQDTSGPQVGADTVRCTVAGALLVVAAAVAALLAVFVLIPLLIQHMAAVGAKQNPREQSYFIVTVGAFALLAEFLHPFPCFLVDDRLMVVLKNGLLLNGVLYAVFGLVRGLF